MAKNASGPVGHVTEMMIVTMLQTRILTFVNPLVNVAPKFVSLSLRVTETMRPKYKVPGFKSTIWSAVPSTIEPIGNPNPERKPFGSTEMITGKWAKCLKRVPRQPAFQLIPMPRVWKMC